ncbi:MAG: hypothetical protein O3B13_01370 [Planctomycetota bacterium]|nr:hypothetical protein [Planctomycetota bacterium]
MMNKVSTALLNPGRRQNADAAKVTTLCVTSQLSHSVRGVPLTSGLDLPRGFLQDDQALILKSPDGNRVELQSTPLAHWSDGSVKWTLLDFVAPNVSPETSLWSIERTTGSAATMTDAPVTCSAETIGLRQENASIVLRRGEQETQLNFVLTTASGHKLQPQITHRRIESSGPVRWTVIYEGEFPKCRGLRFAARISTFQNTGHVKCDVRLHNPNRALHKGGVWDLGDAGSVLFDSFEVECQRSTPASAIHWKTEVDHADCRSDGGTLEIYQDSSGRENWQSRNHNNAAGRIPCRFRGYELRSAGRAETGHHASPTVSLEGGEGTLTVSVPEFWQQFPGSVLADPLQIRVGLFPSQWDDQFELQGGEQKTQTIWLSLGQEVANLQELDWIHKPVCVTTPPEWHLETQAIPYFCPASTDPHSRLSTLLAGAARGEHSVTAKRDAIDEYGWRNFGELWADHETAYYDGPRPIISHYNNQFDSVYGGILQLARTGEVAWFDLFDPLARHVADIDVYHTQEDRAAYNGGLFWHTDHYSAAGTCTHRTYTAQNAKPGQNYGGGPSDEHSYTTGLLYHFYLTGNPESRAAVISLADWVIHIDDGSQTVFGLLDQGPTGLASSTASADFHGPGRGSGNSLNALVDGWLLTGERHYLDYAETLIQRVVHPAEDISQLELLDVESRWSYTVFLSALAKYLDIKHEADEHDDAYQYAVASLAHFGRWMLHNERPYFDHPDQLEFPTETWAAQELRKANVLRLAAKYCSTAERTAMLKRGEELADRAWSDLERFESRHVSRSLAIAMSEGTRDCWLRMQSCSEELTVEPRDWEPKQNFVPQKERVKQQLKSPRGLIRGIVSATNVTRWPGTIRSLLKQL